MLPPTIMTSNNEDNFSLCGDSRKSIHILRDCDTIHNLLNKLNSIMSEISVEKSLTILGNGGIALELIYLVIKLIIV